MSCQNNAAVVKPVCSGALLIIDWAETVIRIQLDRGMGISLSLFRSKIVSR